MKGKCVLSMINEINSLSNKFIANEVKKAELPILINHIPLFFILPDDGADIEFKEIKEKWEISKSSLSDILNKYEERGLINKRATCVDKRCVMISMKPEAMEVKKKLLDIEAKVLNTMVKGFSQEERDKLEENIVTVLDNMKNIV